MRSLVLSLLGLAAFVLCGLPTGPARAQSVTVAERPIDVFHRLRGNYRRDVAPSVSVRAFAYEPVPFERGDTVVVTADRARLMLGRRELAMVEGGRRLSVLGVERGWVGAAVEVDGQIRSGWIRAEDLDFAE
jgi:hypothetical protein